MIKNQVACALMWATSMVMCSATIAQSSYKNVLVYDQEPLRSAPCEPSIAINRDNPAEMVAGAVLTHVFYSMDSGKTWQNDRLKSRHGVFGDPCVVYGEQNRWYYFHLSNPNGLGWSSPKLLDRIVCQFSENPAEKWSRGSGIGLDHPKDQDKEWAHWDGYHKKLLVSWTQFDRYNSNLEEHRSNILFATSVDGRSWSDPVQINQYAGNCLDDSYTTEGATPASGPNGEWYVSWSLNGKIWFDRSTDQGKTWLEQDIIAMDTAALWAFEIPNLGRANGMPITKCDLSNGPNRGTIYINWADQRNGANDTDIWLIKSTDNGNTWSAPLRVNDDNSKTHQFFTWMDIDQSNGNLYFVFYDRRNYTDTQTDVYMAVSRDGGQTFENKRISDKPFTPSRAVFFGDYNNISAASGVVRPIWTRYDQGKLSIWTAIINE